MLDREDHHREVSLKVQRMDSRKLITWEQERETSRGRSYGLVRPNWNGVTQNHITNTWDWMVTQLRSRFGRVPKYTDSGRVVRIASIIVRSGRLGGLETVLCALHQGNIGIGVLQETKLTEGVHMRFSSGYKVCVIEAESRHQRVIVIVWRE